MFWLDRFEIGSKNENIGITPAMPSGSSLKYDGCVSKRAFDVGIANNMLFGRWYGNTRHDRLLQHLLYFSTKSL
jgi:hypothetical protein